MGTVRDYYIWRDANAPEAIRGDNYYVNYGLPMSVKFERSKGGASPEYRTWVDRTRLELQLGLESVLEANPAVELNRGTLFDAAIDTHSDA